MPSILKYAQPVVVKARKQEVVKAKSATPDVEELLDLVVPPQTRTMDDGSLWVQRISSTPATRTDAVHVQVRARRAARSHRQRTRGLTARSPPRTGEPRPAAAGAAGARGGHLPRPRGALQRGHG